jgi:hypothetical protein
MILRQDFNDRILVVASRQESGQEQGGASEGEAVHHRKEFRKIRLGGGAPALTPKNIHKCNILAKTSQITYKLKGVLNSA